MMNKKYLMTFFLATFICVRPAHAIFDIMAMVESGLEYAEEIKHKIAEIQKFKDDQLKRLKQGFDLANSCYKNPMSCGSSEMLKFLKENGNSDIYIKKRNQIFTMPGSEMGNGDIASQPQEKFAEDVVKTYIYKRGRGKTAGGEGDLVESKKNRDNINKVIANETALMFAKGATTRHSIQGEDDSQLYPDIGDKNNMDEILQAESRVTLATASRLARVLELRANMVSSQSTAELTQQTVANEDDE